MQYATIVCPECTATFKQESKFLKHLQVAHDVVDVEAYYVKTHMSGDRPKCKCSSTCTEFIKWNGWKRGYTSSYARGHNARVDSCFNDPSVTKVATEKRLRGLAEGRFRVWNDGLTKETDARVQASALKTSKTLIEGYETGRIIDWRLRDPQKATDAVKKMSQTKLAQFAAGNARVWNDGLTKSIDPRLAAIAEKISAAHRLKRKMGRRLSNDEIIERISKFTNFELVSSPDDYRTRRVQRLIFRCRVCDQHQAKSLAMLEDTPVCFKCFPKESQGQLELFEFVKGLVPDTLLSDRKTIAPKELDVLVPGRLAIEYDGCYWHSELFLPSDYALQKMRACDAAGIPLLRVFDDEWRDKRSIVEGMIKHRLGFDDIKLGARSCKLVELSTEQRRGFIEMTHLDGDVPSKNAWGLEFDGKLVAALSVRRPFHKKHSGWLEVARYCVRHGTSVAGGLSKLLKPALSYARKEGFRGLMTYVDRRVGDAHGYIRAGFTCISETAPRFWWTDGQRRYDRFKFRADSVRGMTEADVAAENHVMKIWGCPNVVLTIV